MLEKLNNLQCIWKAPLYFKNIKRKKGKCMILQIETFKKYGSIPLQLIKIVSVKNL